MFTFVLILFAYFLFFDHVFVCLSHPVRLCLPVSPEFCYRPGLSAVAEDGSSSGGGAPTRPLPPTPDDDDTHADRTLVMKRVSVPTHHTVLDANTIIIIFYV